MEQPLVTQTNYRYVLCLHDREISSDAFQRRDPLFLDAENKLIGLRKEDATPAVFGGKHEDVRSFMFQYLTMGYDY